MFVVIIVAFSIWFYIKGKKKTTIATVPVDSPTGENNPNAVSTADITQLANELYNDMNGFNWSGHDVTPYQKLDSLSDTDFVNVYNTFNTLHTGEGTLKQWMDSETYVFNDVTDSILDRMARLNLI